MKNNTPLLFLVVFAAVTAGQGIAAPADNKAALDLGKYEYQNSCAACHGVDGKGGGPSADSLKNAPSDLTSLANRNNGVLPFERLYAWIDGRETLKAHGDRAMPIWGKRYSTDSAEFAEYFSDQPRGKSVEFEMYVRTRILALIDYLNRIQAK